MVRMFQEISGHYAQMVVMWLVAAVN